MSTTAWAVLFAVGSVYAFFAALSLTAAKKMPKPEPKPELPEVFLSYRVVMDEEGIPDSVSLDLNPLTEKLLANHEWVKLS